MTTCLCHGGICELSIHCSWPCGPGTSHNFRRKRTRAHRESRAPAWDMPPPPGPSLNARGPVPRQRGLHPPIGTALPSAAPSFRREPHKTFAVFEEDATGARCSERRIFVDQIYEAPFSLTDLVETEVAYMALDLLQGVSATILVGGAHAAAEYLLQVPSPRSRLGGPRLRRVAVFDALPPAGAPFAVVVPGVLHRRGAPGKRRVCGCIPPSPHPRPSTAFSPH